MKLRLILLLAGLSIQTYTYSQVYVFIVCGNRGENSVKSRGEWKLLTPQSTIDQFDQIKTSGENCYLGLLHTSGRSIVITKPGTYNAEDLLKKVNTGTTAVASKYADFVHSKMTTVSAASDNQQRSAGDNPIKVYLPVSGKVFGNEALIRWSETPGNNNYKIIVKNLFDDVVADFICQKQVFRIDLNDPKMKDLNVIFLTVEAEKIPGTRSATYGISRLNDEKSRNNISSTLNELKTELGDESPLNNLIYASFFEDNKLPIDAATCYEHALESAPGVADLEKMYEEFLVRNGMK